jgi:hypothetical protein
VRYWLAVNLGVRLSDLPCCTDALGYSADGFAELSRFYRAFRRWQGDTPQG